MIATEKENKMKKLARILLGLAGFGVLALVFMPESQHHAAASNPAPVFITNTPVPVQGTVAVGNTPSVNVTNTPSVNVANSSVPVSGSVSVANRVDSGNQAIPLVVTAQGTPYWDQCNGFGHIDFNTTCSMHSVPAGLRLVIESASLNTASGTTSDSILGVAIHTTFNGGDTYEYLAPSNTGSATGLFQSASGPIKLFADPGSTPKCSMTATGDVFYDCTISGYLIPAP
jgi:hypothetical protein